MKKLILIVALITISVTGKVYAQSEGAKYHSKSKTQQTFNVNKGLINLKDFIVLNEGRLILELSDLHDYESFRNLDSILLQFRKDISFYKDSLEANPTGGVRIDYALSEDYPFKKIRFKKYGSDGNIFLNQGGDISRLKFEQDTISIVIQKSKPGLGRRKSAPCMIPYSIQATFVLGNYYDIDKVIADKVLKGIVDTCEKESQLKATIKHPYNNPLSIIYNPYYSGKGRFQIAKILIGDENDVFAVRVKQRAFGGDFHLGAGVVRNMMAQVSEFGFQYMKHTKWNMKNYDFFKVSVSTYVLFDKDLAGNYITNSNLFINADVGSVYEGNEEGWIGKRASFGVGYLVVNNGGYFKNTTLKVFTDLEIIPKLTIVPEIIMTDNFKQIFPGFTIKVF
jgi:hypothetical protein